MAKAWGTMFAYGDCLVEVFVAPEGSVFSQIMRPGGSVPLTMYGASYTISVSLDGVLSIDGEGFPAGTVDVFVTPQYDISGCAVRATSISDAAGGGTIDIITNLGSQSYSSGAAADTTFAAVAGSNHQYIDVYVSPGV